MNNNQLNTEQLKNFYYNYPDRLIEDYLGCELKWWQKIWVRWIGKFEPKYWYHRR